MDKIYTIFRQGGSGPKKVHESYQAALKEAERLSANEIGVIFIIMESVTGIYCKPDFVKFPIPFCEKTETQQRLGTEEGDPCGDTCCDGILQYPAVENCSCHITPPCKQCLDRMLTCTTCGREVAE